MTALTLLIVAAATQGEIDITRTLDDGVAAQVSSALRSVDGDARDAYLDSAVTGSLKASSASADDALAAFAVRSFAVSSDDALVRYQEFEKKAREEEEKRAAEEAAKRAESAAQESAGATSSTVGTRYDANSCAENASWLAARLACGAQDTEIALLAVDGSRVDNPLCTRLFAFSDAMASAGYPIDEIDPCSVIAAIAACTCDGTIATSGDMFGGMAELEAHLESSSAYEEVTGSPAPGDVLIAANGVYLFVGDEAATGIEAGTWTNALGSVDPEMVGSYPCLVMAPESGVRIFRPTGGSPLAVAWKDAVS